MPEMNRQGPDITDLADDDVRSVADEKTREVLYRITKKIKECLDHQQTLITTLYDAVTRIEDQL